MKQDEVLPPADTKGARSFVLCIIGAAAVDACATIRSGECMQMVHPILKRIVRPIRDEFNACSCEPGCLPCVQA